MMKEALKKIANILSDYDLEQLCKYSFKHMSHNKSIDVAKEICAALNEEGIISSAENDGIYITNLNKAKEYLANRIWLEDKVISKTAKAKPIKIERNMCKHQVEIGTDEAKKKGLSGIPGRIYCYLWKTPVENVIQIDGRCVPTKYLTQGVPESGTNQWGINNTQEGKPLENIHSTAIKKKIVLAEENDLISQINNINTPITTIISILEELKENKQENQLFNILKIDHPEWINNIILEALENAPEYIMQIIENQLIPYKYINQNSFDIYLNTIKEDEQKTLNFLANDSTENLSFHDNLLSKYLQFIKNDYNKLYNAINSGAIKSNHELEMYEKALLKYVEDNENQLLELLSENKIKIARKEFEENYFKLIANDEIKVENALNNGILHEQNIGEERTRLYLEKIYKDEDKLLEVINNENISTHTIMPFLRDKQINIQQYQNPELREKILEMFSNNIQVLSKWYNNVTDPELKQQIWKHFGEEYKKRYRYKEQSPEDIFKNTQPERFKSYLDKMDMGYKKDYEILRRVEILMRNLGINKWYWNNFADGIYVQNQEAYSDINKQLKELKNNKANYEKEDYKAKRTQLLEEKEKLIKKVQEATVLAQKYSNIISTARDENDYIDLKLIKDTMMQLQEEQQPMAFNEVKSTVQQLRENSYNLVINIDASTDQMNQIEADDYLRAFWSNLHGVEGSTGYHQKYVSSYNNIGWSRIDIYDEGDNKYLFIEELQSDIIDYFAHSNLSDVAARAFREAGLLKQEGDDIRTLDGDTIDNKIKYCYDFFINEMHFNNWQDIAMNKILELARQNKIENVVVMSDRDIMDRSRLSTKSVADKYYNKLPKEYGFQSVPAETLINDIPGASDLKNLWIRKASAEYKLSDIKKTTNLLKVSYLKDNKKCSINLPLNKVSMWTNKDIFAFLKKSKLNNINEDYNEFIHIDYASNESLYIGLNKKAQTDLNSLANEFAQTAKGSVDPIASAHDFLIKVRQILEQAGKYSKEALQKWVDWVGQIIGRKIAVTAEKKEDDKKEQKRERKNISYKDFTISKKPWSKKSDKIIIK